MPWSRSGLARTAVAGAIALATIGGVAANTITAPSSSQSPYVVRAVPGVVTKAILTVGDSPAGSSYRMGGIPDGLGAFDNGDGTFTVLMNHELGGTNGAVRAHGARGAFVSRWVINKGDLAVVSGGDLIRSVKVWDAAAGAYVDATAAQKTFSRFCSADLAEPSAFYNAATGRGYAGRIFLNGEENGADGRAFAHLMDGTSYDLPWLGRFSWENAVASPAAGDATVVAGLDDSGGGQVYFYVGAKQAAGLPVQQAGLTGGRLFSLKVAGVAAETDATALAGPAAFTGVDLGDVSGLTGAQLEQKSKDLGVTAFARPEDGAWDPNSPNDFYFVTTASFTGKSRLWRARFNDASNPAAGGTVEILVEGPATAAGPNGPKMMDNLAVNRRGQVLIQEDPGGQDHIAKIWRYDIASRALSLVAQHDPARFAPGAAGFLTNDEELSGIIDASAILGEGWYLLDVQAHYTLADPELVQGGQLLALHIPPGRK